MSIHKMWTKTSRNYSNRKMFLILFLSLQTQAVESSSKTSCDLRLVLGLPSCDEDFTSNPPNTTYKFCNIPREYLDVVKKTLSCELLIKYNPVCARNFTLAFSDVPPYVHKSSKGETYGMLLSCNDFQILPSKSYTGKLVDQFNKSTAADIVIPIYSNSLATFALPYSPLLRLEQIAVIAKKIETTSEDLMTTLIKSVTQTWPLLLMAFTMAICAGCVIWILDTWVNKSQFPRLFPQGPFEGFWWAFVSMTTVGYGDRTPTSPAARLFAVLWILIGITIFNMFTASLTSELGNHLARKSSFELSDKTVGVLTRMPNINATIRSSYAMPKGFDDIETLKKSLLDGNIEAVAMETPVALWFLHHRYASELTTNYAIQKALDDKGESSIGMTSDNVELLKMIETFTSSSHGYQVTGLDEHLTLRKKDVGAVHLSSFTHTHLSFILTLVLAVVLTLICLALGWFANKRHEQQKHLKKQQIEMAQKENGFSNAATNDATEQHK